MFRTRNNRAETDLFGEIVADTKKGRIKEPAFL